MIDRKVPDDGEIKEPPKDDQPAKLAPEERPSEEVQAEADLLKASGGDPFTQESD